jgi:hypothetical protein
MNTKLFNHHFLRPVKNTAAGMILLLLSILVSSNRYIQKDFRNEKGVYQLKNEPKPRLFLITVIDSDDEIIGKRCEKDLEDITETFNQLTLWLDIATGVQKIIKGNEFSKAAVNDAIDIWLKSQEPNKSDIVIFYYSGHGFRFANDESIFPRMWLKTGTDKAVNTNNLSMEEDIYDRIVKMGAGVNIILSDCCNSVPGVAPPSTENNPVAEKSKIFKKEELDEYLKDFDQLFMPDFPLSIIATASDSTELAGGTPSMGGFFTHFFLEALDMSIYDDELEPVWENIFNYAKEEARKKALGGLCPVDKRTKNGRCIQTARFKIEPELIAE